MPISSGAEGHVGVGVDRSIKWVPEGGEDYQAVRISNSYLQRYLNQYGDQEKIKKEERLMMIKNSVGPLRIHNAQNQVTTKEGSDMYLIGQRRSKPNTVQDSPVMETNSTMYTLENSRKTKNENSHIGANNTHMTSTRQPEKKVMAPTNGPAKKSRVCVIL